MGGGNGGVQFLVRHVQPCRALVVKIHERAFFEFGGAFGVTQFKVRITHLADAGFGVNRLGVEIALSCAAGATREFQDFSQRPPFRRIEPAFVQLVQLFGGGGNGGFLRGSRARQTPFAACAWR